MEEEGQEVSVAEDRAAQEAGFAEAMTDKPPAEKPAAPAAPAETAAPVAAEPAPAVEPTVLIKQSEWDAVQGKLTDLEKENRKNFGQIGRLNKEIEERFKKLPTQTVAGVTKVNPKALERLRAEFNEDLANAFGDDFIITEQGTVIKEEPTPAAAAAPVPAAKVEEVPVVAPTETPEYKAAVKDLDDAHPDRLKLIASPEYTNWLKTLKDDERTKFLSSVSPIYVSGRLTECKAWIKAQADKSKAKKSRLDGAITPEGTPRGAPAVISEKAAEQAAFDAQFT